MRLYSRSVSCEVSSPRIGGASGSPSSTGITAGIERSRTTMVPAARSPNRWARAVRIMEITARKGSRYTSTIRTRLRTRTTGKSTGCPSVRITRIRWARLPGVRPLHSHSNSGKYSHTMPKETSASTTVPAVPPAPTALRTSSTGIRSTTWIRVSRTTATILDPKPATSTRSRTASGVTVDCEFQVWLTGPPCHDRRASAPGARRPHLHLPRGPRFVHRPPSG